MIYRYEVGYPDWDMIGVYYAESPEEAIEQCKRDLHNSDLPIPSNIRRTRLIAKES